MQTVHTSYWLLAVRPAHHSNMNMGPKSWTCQAGAHVKTQHTYQVKWTQHVTQFKVLLHMNKHGSQNSLFINMHCGCHFKQTQTSQNVFQMCQPGASVQAKHHTYSSHIYKTQQQRTGPGSLHNVSALSHNQCLIRTWYMFSGHSRVVWSSHQHCMNTAQNRTSWGIRYCITTHKDKLYLDMYKDNDNMTLFQAWVYAGDTCSVVLHTMMLASYSRVHIHTHTHAPIHTHPPPNRHTHTAWSMSQTEQVTTRLGGGLWLCMYHACWLSSLPWQTMPMVTPHRVVTWGIYSSPTPRQPYIITFTQHQVPMLGLFSVWHFRNFSLSTVLRQNKSKFYPLQTKKKLIAVQQTIHSYPALVILHKSQFNAVLKTTLQ